MSQLRRTAQLQLRKTRPPRPGLSHTFEQSEAQENGPSYNTDQEYGRSGEAVSAITQDDGVNVEENASEEEDNRAEETGYKEHKIL